MDTEVVERGVDTLLINLADVPIGKILDASDTALKQAIERFIHSGDNEIESAPFSNFI